MFQSMRKGFVRNGAHLITALDIGSSKVCCAIARLQSDGSAHLLGLGQHVSRGLKAGAIIDMQSLEYAIRSAVHGAEEMARETVSHVYVSIAPSLIQAVTVRMQASVAGHVIDDTDVRKIIAQAKESAKRPGVEVIHALSTGFHVDVIRGIRDPRGMYGDTMSGHVLLVTAPQGPIRNLYACIERCHLYLQGIVVAPYASGLAALVQDEMDLGVTLIDLGAGMTSLAYFFDSELMHLDTIMVGGSHVTHDIARGLSTPLIQAERLKTLYGSAMLSPSDHRDMITVPLIGDESSRGSSITKAELVKIIRPRIEETFELIRDRLKNLNLEGMASSRIVLTGGASQLPGVREISSLILGKQTRIGRPVHLQGPSDILRSPSFSTVAGLIEYAKNDPILLPSPDQNNRPSTLQKVFNLRQWFRQNV
jgi:cell division protein FtsA